jgi:hypothetical protein
MSRIIIEYNPVLSKESEKLIRDNVTPSMISNDESSCQYQISVVSHQLLVHGQTDDAYLIHELINDGVHYIEF